MIGRRGKREVHLRLCPYVPLRTLKCSTPKDVHAPKRLIHMNEL